MLSLAKDIFSLVPIRLEIRQEIYKYSSIHCFVESDLRSALFLSRIFFSYNLPLYFGLFSGSRVCLKDTLASTTSHDTSCIDYQPYVCPIWI